MNKEDYWLLLIVMIAICLAFGFMIIITAGIRYGLLAAVVPILSGIISLALLGKAVGKAEGK